LPVWRKRALNRREDELKKVPLPLDPPLRPVSEALAGERPVAETRLGDVYAQWGFKRAVDLGRWLDGKWLEHHALDCIQQQAAGTRVHDWGLNPEPGKSGPNFEADVLAVRGYQLFLISCYAGDDKGKSKQHLFEVFFRAQQLGGEEARAALLCGAERLKAGTFEQEVQQDWDARGKVFETRYAPMENTVEWKGVMGEVEYQAHTGADDRDIPPSRIPDYLRAWQALALFAEFCGTGEKTTMGMGRTRRLKTFGPHREET